MNSGKGHRAMRVPTKREGFQIVVIWVALMALFFAARACNPPKPSSSAAATGIFATPTTSSPAPEPVKVGTATDLHGVIKFDGEQPVYAAPQVPIQDHVPLPERIWTLLPGTRVTAICQSPDPAFNYGTNLYVSWAPGKFGYVLWDSVSITDRTADKNEAMDVSALKAC